MWTAPSDIQINTKVTVTPYAPLNLATTGDQIIAYQKDSFDSDPKIIFGFNSDGTNWAANATTANDSALPAGLTDGANALHMTTADQDDCALKDNAFSGDKATILAAICSAANWDIAENAEQAFAGTITMTRGAARLYAYANPLEGAYDWQSGPYTVPLTLINTGDTNAVIVNSSTFITQTGSEYAIPAGQFPINLAANYGKATLNLTFNPNGKTGFFPATLTLKSDNPGGDVVVTLNLSAYANTLNVGDIAVYGVNMDDHDEFIMIPFVGLPAGTLIKFTDRGWTNQNTFYTGSANDRLKQWIVPSNIAAGTNIRRDGLPMSFPGNGDQVFVYQGPDTNPQFVFGLTNDGTAWGTNATGETDSARPAALDALSSVNMSTADIDNISYDGTPASGDRATLLAAICDNTNWLLTGDAARYCPAGTNFPALTLTGIDNPNLQALSAVNFGMISNTSDKVTTIAITNGGASNNLTIDAASSCSIAAFSIVDGQLPMTLLPFETKGLAVRFNPAGVGGAYSGVLTLQSNDASNMYVPITLTGEAGTILSTNGIAIMAFNMDDADEFNFVALENIANGTRIEFTDRGWNAANNNLYQVTNDSVLTWRASSDIAAGTVVNVSTVNPPLNFNTGGDQILAYQMLDGVTPTFVHAINDQGVGTHVWQATGTAEQDSMLPQGLTDAKSCVALLEYDNSKYIGPTVGSKGLLRFFINDYLNWQGNDNRLSPLPTGPFTVLAGTDPELSVLSSSPITFPAVLATQTTNSVCSLVSSGETQSLTIYSTCSITQSGSAFAITSPLPITLPSLTAGSLDLSFTPPSAGTYTGVLNIATNQGGVDTVTTIALLGVCSDLVAPGDIVINELSYDDGGPADDLSFVEIKNISAKTLALNQLQFVTLQGNTTPNPAVVNQTQILSATLLAPGQRRVLLTNGESAGITGDEIMTAITQIENGPDGVALRRASDSAYIDAVMFEDANHPAGSTDSGNAGTQAGDDFNTLQRQPDGTDTNVNTNDFRLSGKTLGFSNDWHINTYEERDYDATEARYMKTWSNIIYAGNAPRGGATVTSYTVEAAGMTGNLVITSSHPARFQVSLDGSTFGASVSLTPVGGNVTTTPVYVQFTPATYGFYDGPGTGEPNQYVLTHADSIGSKAVPLFATCSQPFPIQDRFDIAADSRLYWREGYSYFGGTQWPLPARDTNVIRSTAGSLTPPELTWFEAGNKAHLQGYAANSEYVRRPLPELLCTTGTTLYASVLFRVTQTPSSLNMGNSNYPAFFSFIKRRWDLDTWGDRQGRLQIVPQQAGPGLGSSTTQYQLGIQAGTRWGAGGTTQSVTNLAVNTTYRAIIKYQIVTALDPTSTTRDMMWLWVNPTAGSAVEGDGAIGSAVYNQSTDTVNNEADVNGNFEAFCGYGLCQENASGTWQVDVDEVIVGMSYAQVNPPVVALNEVMYDAPGTDDGYQFAEIQGQAGASLNNVWLLELEGDGSGEINNAVNLGARTVNTLGANGLYLLRDSTTVLQPAPHASTNVQDDLDVFSPDLGLGAGTYLLVTGFTGTAGASDIDTNNDGVPDGDMPWGAVLDAIGLGDNSGTNHLYGATFAGQDVDPAFAPAAAFRDASAPMTWIAGSITGTSPGNYNLNQTSSGTYTGYLTPGNTNEGSVPVTMSAFSIE